MVVPSLALVGHKYHIQLGWLRVARQHCHWHLGPTGSGIKVKMYKRIDLLHRCQCWLWTKGNNFNFNLSGTSDLIKYIALQIEISTKSPQHKNANIANFILVVPLEINKIDEVWNFEVQSSCTRSCIILHLQYWTVISTVVQIKKEIAYMGIQI